MTSIARIHTLALALALAFASHTPDASAATPGFEFTVPWLPRFPNVELAVEDPEGAFHYTRSFELECRGFSVDGDTVSVHTTDAYGVSYADGQGVVRPLFVAPGRYRLWVGENLESDDELNYLEKFDIEVTEPMKSVQGNVPADACVRKT